MVSSGGASINVSVDWRTTWESGLGNFPARVIVEDVARSGDDLRKHAGEG